LTQNWQHHNYLLCFLHRQTSLIGNRLGLHHDCRPSSCLAANQFAGKLLS
jgi:hypothetical protein